MARRFRFRTVDVFADRALAGNPLAVFPEASGLDDTEMQSLARETNLSETCFVLPPSVPGRAAGADYRLRIFTPGTELPFAGHPALGAAWVMADEGRVTVHPPATTLRCEVAIGVLPIRLEVPAGARAGERHDIGEVTMTQGRPEVLRVLDAREQAALCEALGVDLAALGWPGAPGGGVGAPGGGVGAPGGGVGAPGGGVGAAPSVVSTGLPHLVVPLLDRDVLLAIDGGRREHVIRVCRSCGCQSTALVAPGGSGAIAGADVSVRVLDPPELGIAADPATGSAAGPIALYLGRLAAIRDATWQVVLEQGTELGRPSRLRAEVDFGTDGRAREVRVAGVVVPVIEGWLTLE